MVTTFSITAASRETTSALTMVSLPTALRSPEAAQQLLDMFPPLVLLYPTIPPAWLALEPPEAETSPLWALLVIVPPLIPAIPPAKLSEPPDAVTVPPLLAQLVILT